MCPTNYWSFQSVRDFHGFSICHSKNANKVPSPMWPNGTGASLNMSMKKNYKSVYFEKKIRVINIYKIYHKYVIIFENIIDMICFL